MERGRTRGGLYDELLLYVKRSKHDMLLIQETKWRFESSWEDDTHYFIHSGTSAKDHKQAGILTIISKRIVDPGSLRFISAIKVDYSGSNLNMGRGKWTSSTSTSTRGAPPHMSRRCVTKPGMPLHIKFRLCPFVAG